MNTNLHDIRRQIDALIGDDTRADELTALIMQRDALRATESPAAELTSTERNARMLQSTHG